MLAEPSMLWMTVNGMTLGLMGRIDDTKLLGLENLISNLDE